MRKCQSTHQNYDLIESIEENHNNTNNLPEEP